MNIQEIRKRYDEIFVDKIYKEKDIYYHILSKLCEGRTLDVGCGNGAGILAKVKNSIGLDISEVAAKKLQDDGYRIIVGDASYLPFKQESFETVISLGSLEHFLNPDTAIKEMHRVLIKGKQLILVVDAKKSIFFQIISKIKYLYHKIKGVELLENQPIEKYFSKNKIVDMLLKSKFRVVFHGEYSKACIQIGKLKKIIAKLPFFVRTSPYVWVIVALKDVQGQEDVYGPYFPLRGFWKLRED